MRSVRDILFSIKDYGREMQQRVIIPCLQCVRDGESLPKGRCRRGHDGVVDEDSECSDAPSYEFGFDDDNDDDEDLL